MSGIGAHVNEIVSIRNGFLPHTSDRAPIHGCDTTKPHYKELCYKETVVYLHRAEFHEWYRCTCE